MLDFPYVNPVEFRAHPTFIDSHNLRVPGKDSDQDAALTNVLLTASQWADDEVDMPLAAHLRVERARCRVSRQGLIRYHPEHAPVIEGSVGMSFGPGPGDVEPASSPAVWLEQDGHVIVVAPGGGQGLDALQFGRTPAFGELFVEWTYTAAYPITLLAADAVVSSTALTVLGTTGIIPGTVLRLWTPGAEEAVTVLSVAGSTVNLAAPTRNAHAAGDTCSALPTTARQAVINYACALLMRPGTQQSSTTSNAPARSTTAGDPTRSQAGQNLIHQACRLLANFQRVR